ncbi:MAG: hypothetical protein EXQ74_07220 [Thermoleophilia bacterium]|nr:hypothetical protein [Thermoleophilia bacterium]
MRSLWTIARTEAHAIRRRRWYTVLLALGGAFIIAGAILAATRNPVAGDDTLRSWVAAVELIGGLVVATTLGASAVNRDADGGWLGMQVATGVPRPQVALGRILGRVLVLAMTFGVWIVLAAAMGVVTGHGGDGPLAVSGVAMFENMLLVLTFAALCSVALGPIAAGVMGVLAEIVAQALVNLQAAVDADVIGTAWSGLIAVLYAMFPRGIVSPMLSELQARDAAGIAAPQLEINGNIVYVIPSTWLTVIWTLLWCILLAMATAGALRRRALS